MRLFISGAHPPSVISRGLYAGLKSFNGRHTSLPVVLDDDIYVNAGFIDGLNVGLVSTLQLKDIALRLVFRGSLLVQWYFLDEHAEVRHLSDSVIKQNSKDTDGAIANIRVPAVLLTDSSVRLVYFRVLNNPSRAESRPSHLINWCFHCEKTERINKDALLMVSRSLGDSPSAVDQHLKHYKHYLELRKDFPDLDFASMPVLHIYESDDSSYEASKELLSKNAHNNLPVRLFRNQYNLGGGGNMYLALNSSVGDSDYCDDFLMVDSDTLVPFKTLYTTALLSKCSDIEPSNPAPVLAPVIAYRSQGTRILEAGAIFGRGAWNIYEEYPVQPCISPLFHGLDLADKAAQAKLSGILPTDYPPFIYSLYRINGHSLGKNMMPSPFFLRGDDVEYGFFLKDQGLATKVLGSMLVFQDPKHSPWHEFMAILHATTILIAYCKEENRLILRKNIYEYFKARHDHHLAMSDLKGLMIYSNVLSRLCILLDANQQDLIGEYYNSEAYLALRSLNSTYSEANYLLACQISDEPQSDEFIKLPFLYYDGLLNSKPVPKRVFLLNHLSKTAAIFSPSEVPSILLADSSITFIGMLGRILSNFETLRKRCLDILDREDINVVFKEKYQDAMSQP